MHRFLSLLIALLPACGGASDELAEHDMHPCDPGTEERDEPFPPEPAPVCGDGRATKSRTRCFRRCDYGCGTDGCGDVQCEWAEERCDGADHGAWACTDNGYAGGTVGCTPDCEIDWSRCEACISGPGLRCARAPFVDGTLVGLAVVGARVAVVFVEPSGNLHVSYVDRSLSITPRAPIAPRALAALVVGTRVAFVKPDRQLRIVDLSTRADRRIGAIGDSDDILLLREVAGTGIAAVTNSRMSQGLAVTVHEIDGSPPAFDRPRYFEQQGTRVGVVPVRAPIEDARFPAPIAPPARIVGYARGAYASVYVWRGDALARFLPDAGQFSWPDGAVAMGWSDYRELDRLELRGAPPIEHRGAQRLPLSHPGLAPVATAGVDTIDAFGGTLVVNTRVEPGEVGLYLVEGS